ncbi:Prophage antirepressor [Modicisalibacter ilicicola DSM 19980]|uniref:Prophage antirepressor n=1 Tax=Modicisalibacter ilicicola DSM 19980 TaxID=1121942 RepID=A0A1M4Y5B4_9GAMM|nr:BRO family protein [Halomonas ilicicola]SHF00816.1 Prophage antirepressor [Halomonas ilicicola DSM 19980]
MTNALIPFNFGDNLIRSTVIEGKPWFVAKDIADALGYNNTSKAVNTHCKRVETCPTEMGGQVRHVQIIPNGDVYRLISRSKLPSAEQFEGWLFDEMLPELFRTGSYSVKGQQHKQHLEDQKNLHRNIDLAHKLTERIRREPNEELRHSLYAQLQVVHEAMGIAAPSLDAIGTRLHTNPTVDIDSFWEALDYFQANEIAYNHYDETDRLAINVPEIQRLAKKHGIPLPAPSQLRRGFKTNARHRLIGYTTVHSRILGRSVKCWTFSLEE